MFPNEFDFPASASQCLTEDEWRLLVSESMSTSVREQFYAHLSDCPRCQSRYRNYIMLVADLSEDPILPTQEPRTTTLMVDGHCIVVQYTPGEAEPWQFSHLEMGLAAQGATWRSARNTFMQVIETCTNRDGQPLPVTWRGAGTIVRENFARQLGDDIWYATEELHRVRIADLAL